MKTQSRSLLLALVLVGTRAPMSGAQWVTTNPQIFPVTSSTDAFRRLFPAADGLFNAFDYGHAILYETLWTMPNAPIDRKSTSVNSSP